MAKKIKWIIVSLFVPILLIAGYYGYSIITFGMQIQKGAKEMGYSEVKQDNGGKEQVDKEVIPEWEGKERVNILLLGADGREEGDHGRSDTIMVLSIDPVSKKAHLFSILRDTYVEIPGHGHSRINSAFAYGGPKLTMKVVGNLMGLPIHYYFYVELDSFIALVDAIGGVDLYVEKDMKYTDTADKQEYQIDLKEGMQHLDGNKALQYVRFRKDALSDYARTERQRKFLKAVADKMQSTSTLVNVPNILNKIAPYIETNMDLSSMIKLAVLGYKIKANSMVTEQIPPMDLLREETINGAAVLTVDQKRLRAFIEGLFQADEVGPGHTEEPLAPNPR